jgi:hypothetical protein
LGASTAHSHTTLLTEKVTITDTEHCNHGEGRLAHRALVSFGALLSVAVPNFWQAEFFIQFVFLILFYLRLINFDGWLDLNVRSAVVAAEFEGLATFSLRLFQIDCAKTQIFKKIIVILGLLLCLHWGNSCGDFGSPTVHEPILLSNRHFGLGHLELKY